MGFNMSDTGCSSDWGGASYIRCCHIRVCANGNTLISVVFLAWSLIVGVMYNILKPLVMGRGINVPTIVILIGAIGSFLFSGIIRLFTGAVFLLSAIRCFRPGW